MCYVAPQHVHFALGSACDAFLTYGCDITTVERASQQGRYTLQISAQHYDLVLHASDTCLDYNVCRM